MSYVEVPGAKVPIRMWADPASVEDVAMQQLRNVATLPWIKGLAVMPDVHFGKGATVGSQVLIVLPPAEGEDGPARVYVVDILGIVDASAG